MNVQPPVTGAAGRIRRVSVAEELADILRARILDGGMRDGDMLPKQSDLLDEYEVGKTTLRQAIRILETEGLLTVRRGNTGGAVVRLPREEDAARTFGLVLHSRRVPLEDLALALRQLEPTCASLCAQRPDRDTEVVPRLLELHRHAETHVDDLAEFVRASRAFHEGIVRHCGNTTMQVVLGTIETLWSAQEHHWITQVPDGTDFTARKREGLRVHAEIIERIAEGDADGAYRLASRHVAFAQSHPLGERPGGVVRQLRT